MSESVSGVDAIVEKLRAQSHLDGDGERVVFIDVAEAAVHATVREIVDALAHDHSDLNLDHAGHRHIANERERSARWVARRFGATA